MTEQRIYLSPPSVGDVEMEYAREALKSNWIAPLGPHVDAFESELAGTCRVGHAAALASGTAALHLALLLSGATPGDEILCPTLTFVATANPIVYVGARPVFIDSDSATWTVDPDLLEEELTASRRRGSIPRAVITVDLYGQCADYARIESLCAEFGVAIIEDASQALGATAFGRPAGSFGDLGVLSFNGNKIITTSGGGALLSNSAETMQRARFGRIWWRRVHHEHSYARRARLHPGARRHQPQLHTGSRSNKAPRGTGRCPAFTRVNVKRPFSRTRTRAGYKKMTPPLFRPRPAKHPARKNRRRIW